MNRTSHRAGLFTLAAIAATLTTHMAFATPSSPDLRSTCPGVDEALQDALSQAWMRHRINGTVRVDMQMQGERVVGAIATSGPMAYRSAVRRAVHNLKCVGGGEEARSFRFDVEFTDAPATPSQG